MNENKKNQNNKRLSPAEIEFGIPFFPIFIVDRKFTRGRPIREIMADIRM